MQAYKAMFLAMAVYILIRYWLRFLHPGWEKRSLAGKIEHAPMLAALEKLQEQALIAAIVLGTFALGLGLAAVSGRRSEPAIALALSVLRGARGTLKWIEAAWSGTLFAFAFVLFAVMQYRVLRKQVVDNIVEAVRRRAAELGNVRPVEFAEMTKEMRQLAALLASAYEKSEALGPNQPGQAAVREQIKHLEARFAMLDLERRVRLEWEGEPKGQGRASRIWGALTEKGVLTRMKGIKLWLSYATTALLVASLVGLQAPAAGGTLEKQIVKLEDLRVLAAMKQAEAEWNEAREQTNIPKQAPAPSTPQQKEALQQLARDYTRTFVRAWRTGGATSAKARAEFVRYTLRKQAAEQETHRQETPGTSADVPNSSGGIWSKAEEAALHDYERASTNPDYGSNLEEKVAKDAADAGLHFAQGIDKEATRASAGRVAPADVEDVIIREAAGGLVGSAGEVFGSSDIAKMFAGTVTEGLKSFVAKAFKLGETAYFTYFLRTGSSEQARAFGAAALDRVISADFKARFEQERPKVEPDFAEKLRAANPAPRDGPWVEKAETVLKDLPEEAREGNERNLANLVSDYETEFPRGKGTFARDRLLLAWGIPDANGLEQRVARASNFEQLQSYSRVGGILFGREPQASTTVPFSTLTWRRGTDGYRITLVGAKMIELGPFPPYLLNQALAYAADGRATVLTMMNGETIGRKQVIMHPAFENTALGCRLIAADEWIFDYTDSGERAQKSEVRRTLDRAGTAVELYKEAIKLIQDPSSSRLPAGLPQPLAEDAGAGVRMLLPQAKGLGFDATLLGAIEGCAARQAVQFTECISHAGKELKKTLPQKPPLTGFVSQIREQPYIAGPELAGFLIPPASADPLWPLQLTVQLTVNDTAWWEFPGFPKTGPGIVLAGIERDGKQRQLQELRELCLLQRVFRTALLGGLGEGFPVESLIALQAETAKTAAEKGTATPRWLADRGDQQPLYARELQSELERDLSQWDRLKRHTEATQEVKPKLSACRDALMRAGQSAEAAGSCNFDFEEAMRQECARQWDRVSEEAFQSLASCRLFGIARVGIAAAKIYELRAALEANSAPPKGSALECARQAPPVELAAFARLR